MRLKSAMNISELKGLLRNFDANGELDKLIEALEPFEKLDIEQFADLLKKQNTPLQTTTSGSQKQDLQDPELAKQCLQQYEQLFDRSIDPDVTYAVIEQQVSEVGKPLKKSDAIYVARKFGVAEPIKSKKEALQKIEHRIARRKEGHDHLNSVRNLESK